MHCGLAGRASVDVIVSDKMRRLDWKMNMLMGLRALRNRVGLGSTVVIQNFESRKFTWY